MRDDMSDADRLAVVQDLIRFRHAGEKRSFETLWSVAVTADGRTVVAGDEAGSVHFFDLDLP